MSDGHNSVPDPRDLLARLAELRAREPGLRERDAAAQMGVSEAELVAARCGDGTIRLDGRWPEIVQAFRDVGPVMSLTRNEYAVHEKTGRFEEVSVSEHGGLVVGADIDLRINFGRWKYGYFVTSERPGGTLRSFQFFDAAGTAVQKVYARDETDDSAFAGLARRHAARSQTPSETLSPPRPPDTTPPEDVDVTALRKRWSALEDVHDFIFLLRDFGLTRTEAYRAVGAEFAEEVEPGSGVAILERAAADALPIMIFVPSPGVVQIHTGPVRTLKRVGPWFNVLDPHFNLHLRDDGIASAWIVRKPTRNGIISSLELFDAEGGQIAWLFGERERGRPERADWRAMLQDLPRFGRQAP